MFSGSSLRRDYLLARFNTEPTRRQAMKKMRTLLAIVTVSCFAWNVSTAMANGSQPTLERPSIRLPPPPQPNVSTGPVIVPPAPTPGG
jgi:hypothetical protein